MQLCVFEDDRVDHFLPLVYTRAVYDLRIGRRTLLEAISDTFPHQRLALHSRLLVADETMQEHCDDAEMSLVSMPTLFVNGRLIAEPASFIDEIINCTQRDHDGRVFLQKGVVVAAWLPNPNQVSFGQDALGEPSFGSLPKEELSGVRFIDRLWHLLDELRPALHRDFEVGVHGVENDACQLSTSLSNIAVIGRENIHKHPTSKISPGVILNAEDGPIWIGKNATIMEGSVLRGPVFIGDNAVIKVFGNIEGSSIGPWSKVTGEVHSTVFHSFSNKGHQGFLGHAYLGRWCNLGADTNNSNLRNDYGPVSLYNTVTQKFEKSDRQFLGMFMADHSKSGIDTMFNTGTVVGVSCNLYGSGFHPRYIPSFTWGSPDTRYVIYRMEKALMVARAMMARRNILLSASDRLMLQNVFTATEESREAFLGMKL